MLAKFCRCKKMFSFFKKLVRLFFISNFFYRRKFSLECHFNLRWKFVQCFSFPIVYCAWKILLASMQQAEATRVEAIFVTPAQKLRSFLFSIWAILQTTKWHEINTLECVHFYFLYPCSAYLHEISTSCVIVLDLKYIVASR